MNCIEIPLMVKRREPKVKRVLASALVSALAFAVSIMVVSCANLVKVKIDVVDQRTALENQVLGSYRHIDGDMALMASVRSIDSSGRLKQAPVIPPARKKAIRAMQRSRFNQDDIERFKNMGAIGETSSGYLKYLPTGETKSNRKLERFITHLVDEENEDRGILYRRVMAINENFRADDLPRVEAIMAGLNRDSAKQGQFVQLDSGRWTRKTGKR